MSSSAGGRILGLVGGLFLLWLAWKTVRAEPGTAATVTERRGGLAGAYLSILGLTLTNPMTILSFGALFAGLGVTGENALESAVITLGVFAGSAFWWVVLTTAVGAAPVAADDPLAARDQRRLGRDHRRVRVARDLGRDPRLISARGRGYDARRGVWLWRRRRTSDDRKPDRSEE